MPSVVFDNFKAETTEIVESDGKNNLHAVIDSSPILYPRNNIFSPPYYDTTIGINYPLYGWRGNFSLIDLTSLYSGIGWTNMVSSAYYLSGSPSNVAISDRKGNVVLFSSSSLPSAAKSTPFAGALGICVNLVNFRDKLVLTHDSYNNVFYYINNDLSGSWTSVSMTSGSMVYSALVFNNGLFLGGENPSGGQKVARYNTSFNLVGNLIINTLGRIIGLRNFNNQYIAIFIREEALEYMILWNGDVNSNSSDRYYLPGKVLDAISFNGTLFVLVDTRDGFAVYYFNGSGFSLFFRNNKYRIKIPAYGSAYMRKIMNVWEERISIFSGSRVLFFSPTKNEIFGLGLNSGIAFSEGSTNYFEIENLSSLGTYNYRWAFYYSSESNGLIYRSYFTQEGLSPPGINYYYRSNWIVLGKRIKLTNFKMYYTPDESSNYYLNIRIGYIDEKTGGTIQTKDYNFKQNDLPNSYKEFNINIECTKFFVQIWTDPNNTNTPSKSIRRAIIDYEQLE